MDELDVALRLARAFDTLEIPYFVGGSLASSLQGEPRATNDIDCVVELNEGQVEPLSEALGTDFELDADALKDAVRGQSSWNIFFLPLAVKIDLFVLRTTSFDRSEFSRRRLLEIRPGQSLMIKSPEDSVLRKLLWFQQGGSVSSTQWRDVVEVLRVSGPSMDPDYLTRWADTLKVDGLLSRAMTEAGV